ncbi:hypothetical protein Q253_02612 [Staphylococcus aureus M1270]|nr:hypothetical protein Q253_02612 [Staphylococcus aureus M1270]
MLLLFSIYTIRSINGETPEGAVPVEDRG